MRDDSLNQAVRCAIGHNLYQTGNPCDPIGPTIPRKECFPMLRSLPLLNFDIDPEEKCFAK